MSATDNIIPSKVGWGGFQYDPDPFPFENGGDVASLPYKPEIESFFAANDPSVTVDIQVALDGEDEEYRLIRKNDFDASKRNITEKDQADILKPHIEIVSDIVKSHGGIIISTNKLFRDAKEVEEAKNATKKAYIDSGWTEEEWAEMGDFIVNIPDRLKGYPPVHYIEIRVNSETIRVLNDCQSIESMQIISRPSNMAGKPHEGLKRIQKILCGLLPDMGKEPERSHAAIAPAVGTGRNAL